jgi:hypothetical protein
MHFQKIPTTVFKNPYHFSAPRKIPTTKIPTIFRKNRRFGSRIGERREKQGGGAGSLQKEGGAGERTFLAGRAAAVIKGIILGRDTNELCKYCKMSVLGPLFGAVTWLYHEIFLQPLIRLFFSMAFWNRTTSGFRLWCRKVESDNEIDHYQRKHKFPWEGVPPGALGSFPGLSL